MSAKNSTTHYKLPSFIGSDKPAWLVDWNGAMATIDSAIYEAKQAADAAGTSASAVASDLATLSGTVSAQGSTISTLSDTLTTAVGNINTINGNITTINSLIGNGTPTTTDQTIIGAINEINANLNNNLILKAGDTLTLPYVCGFGRVMGTGEKTLIHLFVPYTTATHVSATYTSAYGNSHSGSFAFSSLDKCEVVNSREIALTFNNTATQTSGICATAAMENLVLTFS